MARVKDALAILELQTQDSGHVNFNAPASVLMNQMPVSHKSDGGQSEMDAELGLMLNLAFVGQFLERDPGGASFHLETSVPRDFDVIANFKVQDASIYQVQNVHI